MQQMNHIVSLTLALLLSVAMWAKDARETVVFDVDLHCQGCITKIEKNIAFERGVKDLICNLDDKTVTVVFDPAKTDISRLQAAFAKINKPAKVHTNPDNNTQGQKPEAKTKQDVDAQTGASTPQ